MLIFFRLQVHFISYFYFMMSQKIFPEWLNDKGIAMLIDPDIGDPESWERLSFKAKECGVKLILVGGSFLHKNNLQACIQHCKLSGLPVWIFPGSGGQICEDADGILLLSLLSGRNAEFLIGQHVLHARLLRDSQLPLLSTAYLLVDGGRPTTVSYVSNTTPIPRDKPFLASATALAGEQLGMSLVYLDAGSGAEYSVSTTMIAAVANEVSLPLFVGGGISTVQQVADAIKAGASWVVVGSKIEKDADFLNQLKQIKF
jgi:putative glycerol-1-phosphate prenyltransferase